jgi:hypothetical protein
MKSEMDTLRTNKSNAEKESLVQASVDKAEATKNINALKAEKERLEVRTCFFAIITHCFRKFLMRSANDFL